jgi:hypothetical protein
MRRTIQSSLMLVALWGALLTIALYQGWEMPRWLSPSQTSRSTKPALEATTPSAPTTPSPVITAAPPPAPVETPLARYRVCNSAAPVLSSVQLGDMGSELAVHCGDTLHVIALTAHAVPQRILKIALPARNPGETPSATTIASADLNGDGLVDLLIPWLTVDEWQHPIGRDVLALLRDSAGAFRPATRVLAATPVHLAAAALDAQAGTDFVILQATDESVHKPREAWWVSGGTAPRRTATSKLAAQSETIALNDVDRDGQTDVIAVSSTESRIDIVFGNGDGTATAAAQLPANGCNELLVADLDGDAHGEVICTGDHNYVIEVRADRSASTQEISFTGQRVHSLHAADLNADGRLELIGYAHPRLVRLERGAGFSFEPRELAELIGTGFAPLAVLVADLNHDNELDLAMLGRVPGDAQSVDLVIVDRVRENPRITVHGKASALPDARLLLTPASL